jgi:hypothetical protein
VVNAPSLARWVVITGLLAVTGLIYVYLTIQLSHLGDQKKALEKSLADLRMQNQMAQVQIATLTSRPALEHRLKEGYLKLVSITTGDIVRLNMRTTGDDAVQSVSNERGTR